MSKTVALAVAGCTKAKQKSEWWWWSVKKMSIEGGFMVIVSRSSSVRSKGVLGDEELGERLMEEK